MWHLAHLSAKHELPFQIHTGNARIQGSNPMLLVDYIEANPKTKFILFHGSASPKSSPSALTVVNCTWNMPSALIGRFCATTRSRCFPQLKDRLWKSKEKPKGT